MGHYNEGLKSGAPQLSFTLQEHPGGVRGSLREEGESTHLSWLQKAGTETKRNSSVTHDSASSFEVAGLGQEMGDSYLALVSGQDGNRATSERWEVGVFLF